MMKTAAAAMLVATSLAGVTAPAARADDPVPTVDEVVAIMAELTDPGKPAASKNDIVTPGLAPDEAGTADDHLNRLNGRGFLPFNFVITDIQSGPDGAVGATVVAQSNRPHSPGRPTSVVLVNQGGRWLITHDAATVLLNAVWDHFRAHYVG